MKKSDINTGSVWWHVQQVPVGQTLICRLGPLQLRIQHLAEEWRVAATHEDEAPGSVAPVSLDFVAEPLDDDKIERFIKPGDGGCLLLKPVMPDRPVVIRPRQPVFLPSQSETTLYLSTPVWLQLRVGKDNPTLLREVPALPLSDTWFGPSTREGELCYSDKTRARNTLAEVPYRPHRVLTPVRVRNEADSVLPLEKLSLPVPALSIYGARDGSLHSQGVTLLRRSDTDMASMSIGEKPFVSAGEVSLITPPRQPGRGGLVRAFSLFFGN